MKITEIVLVTENWKGTEKNCLMTAEDYLKYLDLDKFDSRKDVAEAMLELGKTFGDESEWSEHYFAANVTVYARFCTDDVQLAKFLGGFYNSTDQQVSFDKGMCSGECLDKLSELGMDVKGRVRTGNLSYTRVDYVFEQGQTLHNLNGSDYRVMEKLSDRNLLLMDIKTGNFVVAQGTDMFARHPRGENATEANSLMGIEWGQGLYLGSTPSTIDFRHIRQEYGTKRTIEDICQYREMLQDRFRLYTRMEKDELLSDEAREAIMLANFKEFGTSDYEHFRKGLHEGLYDKGFAEMQEKQKEKFR